MPRQTRAGMMQEIGLLKEALENSKKELNVEKERLAKEKNDKIEEINNKKEEEIKNLNALLEEERKQHEDKKKQLDLRETKKLAKAYEDQKGEFKDDIRYWSGWLIFSSFVLCLAIFLLILFSNNRTLVDQIQYYIIVVLLGSLVVFCTKQYSYYVRLRNDFANRQALAQSYYNIISGTEDIQIKDKFLAKTVEILCAKIETETEHDILPSSKAMKLLDKSLDIIQKEKV